MWCSLVRSDTRLPTLFVVSWQCRSAWWYRSLTRLHLRATPTTRWLGSRMYNFLSIIFIVFIVCFLFIDFIEQNPTAQVMDCRRYRWQFFPQSDARCVEGARNECLRTLPTTTVAPARCNSCYWYRSDAFVSCLRNTARPSLPSKTLRRGTRTTRTSRRLQPWISPSPTRARTWRTPRDPLIASGSTCSGSTDCQRFDLPLIAAKSWIPGIRLIASGSTCTTPACATGYSTGLICYNK